ncbi:SrfA family protein [Minwuia thermotolerans]|uniref:Uncharacterized protein n=1 Tax=Minwuia thermotolerans TaxID=2056226 RepID=A0A2M9FW89_9PROT|nr:SrfA family protein [Minwuia thermotolerans]PJK27722.1 hypothetical protein CVT23_20750 [Minwuia thermotolerans]
MRTGPTLAEDRLDRYQPLGAFGQPVYQNHLQLQAALRQRLGAKYANFFAIPRMDSQGRTVSWISPVEGEPVRWSDLSEEDQVQRSLDLQVMKSEFDAYASELRAYGKEGRDPRGAEAFVAVLDQALKTPDDGHLYFVGDQPVATFWGFREEDAQPFETLTAAPRLARAAAPAAASGEAPERRGLGFLWWLVPLLLLLLLALLLWWLWDDLPVVGGGDEAPAIERPLEDETEAPPPAEEGAVVEDPDRTVIERDGVIVDGEGDAVAVPGEGGEVIPGEDTAVPGEGDAVAPEGAVADDGEGGSTAEEAETPEEQPAPGEEAATEEQPPAEPEAPDAEEGEAPPEGGEPETPPGREPAQPEGQTPDAGEPPAIPEGASDGSAGFMQGNWRSDSGLVDSQTRQKLTQEYNFDEEGRGEAVIRRADGVTCRAPAEATVRDGNLQVEELENLECSDGSSFKRSQTVCSRGDDGQVQCVGTDADGKTFKVDLNRNAQP